MSRSVYKSFAYQFDPLLHLRLTTDIYVKVDALLKEEKSFWLHFDNPSNHMQQQLSKRFLLPKIVRMILFAKEAQSRYVKSEQGFVFIVQGVQLSTMVSNDNFPTLRFWITPRGILSFSTGRIQALSDVQLTIKQMLNPSPMTCFVAILESLLVDLEASVVQLDVRLDQIEAHVAYNHEDTQNMMAIRQDIIFLRRYLMPQKMAFTTLAARLDEVPDSVRSILRELSDQMFSQIESVEMIRERAMIAQDNLINQMANLSNRRMYVLTVIMLIFTPAFFIMSLFSMYLPIPGMQSPITWWVVIVVISVVSLGLYWLFKRKNWL